MIKIIFESEHGECETLKHLSTRQDALDYFELYPSIFNIVESANEIRIDLLDNTSYYIREYND